MNTQTTRLHQSGILHCKRLEQWEKGLLRRDLRAVGQWWSDHLRTPCEDLKTKRVSEADIISNNEPGICNKGSKGSHYCRGRANRKDTLLIGKRESNRECR